MEILLSEPKAQHFSYIQQQGTGKESVPVAVTAFLVVPFLSDRSSSVKKWNINPNKPTLWKPHPKLFLSLQCSKSQVLHKYHTITCTTHRVCSRVHCGNTSHCSESWGGWKRPRSTVRSSLFSHHPLTSWGHASYVFMVSRQSKNT